MYIIFTNNRGEMTKDFNSGDSLSLGKGHKPQQQQHWRHSRDPRPLAFVSPCRRPCHDAGGVDQVQLVVGSVLHLSAPPNRSKRKVWWWASQECRRFPRRWQEYCTPGSDQELSRADLAVPQALVLVPLMVLFHDFCPARERTRGDA